MDFKTFFYKNILMGFFVATTCICAAMAIIGMLFEPDMRFGYQGLFFPLVFGAVTMLPSVVNYSKHELSIREAFVRKLFQFVLIELIILLMVYSSGTLNSVSLAISLALSVLLIFGAVHLVLWINDRKTAEAFNAALKDMQQQKHED